MRTQKTVVRRHPGQDGVFELHRGDFVTVVRQGSTKIGGALIKFTVETPRELDDPTPIILVPGYGGIKPAYKELRKAVAKNGRTAVTFRPPRTQEKLAMLHPNHFSHPERLLAQSVLAIARDLIQNRTDKDEFDQTETVGHSMGGPAVTNAAEIHPEWFRSATLMASAGLDGHTLLDMARRSRGVFAGEILPSIRDIKVRRDVRAVRDIAHYVARNPWRTTAEGLAVGSGDIRPKLLKVGELGVKTAALQFSNDHFFPEKGVQEQAGHLFDLYKVFPNPVANHMWPQLEPSAVAKEIVDISHALNNSEPVAA